MDRAEFLKHISTGTILVCASCNLISCSSKDDPTPTVDFTLDLLLPINAALQNVGGSLSKDGVIVVKVSTTEFIALSQACTHAGTRVNYRPTQLDFHCPNHGSVFDKNGVVKTGPATIALKKYNTELSGDNLRVF